jgi:hypothetical protein
LYFHSPSAPPFEERAWSRRPHGRQAKTGDTGVVDDMIRDRGRPEVMDRIRHSRNEPQPVGARSHGSIFFETGGELVRNPPLDVHAVKPGPRAVFSCGDVD